MTMMGEMGLQCSATALDHMMIDVCGAFPFLFYPTCLPTERETGSC